MAHAAGSGDIRILILDDDEDDIFLIRDAIQEGSPDVQVITTAHKPDEAAEILRQGLVDIVLCDYLLGATSGVEFITEMRAEGIEVPIILLTGMGSEMADKAALEAGASDFLSKDSLTPEIIDRAVRYSIANAERQNLVQTVLDNVDAAVVLIDEQRRPTLWNPEFAELAEQFIAAGRTETSEPRDPSDGAEEPFARFIDHLSGCHDTVTVEGRVLDKKTSSIAASGSSVIVLHDVTEHISALREREAAEKRAAYLAMNCSLTGLPNRNAYTARIEQEIASAEADGHEFHVLNIDLNKFKSVNDSYGHTTGDTLLKEAARRLQQCCEGDDFVARLGGDEFMAIQRVPSGERRSRLAERVAEQFADPIALDDVVLYTGVSVGVAIYPLHGRTSEELLAKADIAMYRAKADPLKSTYVFDEALDMSTRQTRQVSHALRHAIENREIEVHFQPQADMRKHQLTGFEALARWHHAELGVVSPGTFVPIAEDNGLITKLGELVLTRACEIAAGWSEPLKIAVNISPVQILHIDLTALVQEILIKTALSPGRLELEVTESVLINDTTHALHVLRGIKNLGVSIALDDFGTGYSSLSTLISFPFDKVKIDRSFIQGAASNHQAAVVTKTMIMMAKQLGYRIIAEGVETQDHVDFLLEQGCHEMQGYLIGKPVGEDDIEFSLRGDTGSAPLIKSA